jgi:hypothetical protein
MRFANCLDFRFSLKQWEIQASRVSTLVSTATPMNTTHQLSKCYAKKSHLYTYPQYFNSHGFSRANPLSKEFAWLKEATYLCTRQPTCTYYYCTRKPWIVFDKWRSHLQMTTCLLPKEVLAIKTYRQETNTISCFQRWYLLQIRLVSHKTRVHLVALLILYPETPSSPPNS